MKGNVLKEMPTEIQNFIDVYAPSRTGATIRLPINIELLAIPRIRKRVMQDVCLDILFIV